MHQGLNEGPVPGPSTPPGCHNIRGSGVRALAWSLVLISGVQRKLNAPWLHTEQLSQGFRPPPCKQLCAFRLFFKIKSNTFNHLFISCQLAARQSSALCPGSQQSKCAWRNPAPGSVQTGDQEL